MSKRPVLTPSGLVFGESMKDTVEVLQSRLAGTESDTQLLARQLKELGFKPDQSHYPESIFHVEDKSDTIAPFKDMSCNDMLVRNYEGMVSRVCKLESMIHTIKLNILRLQSSQELVKKEKVTATERLAVEQDSHAQEMHRLNQDMKLLRQQCLQEAEAHKNAEEKANKLQATLGEATLARSAANLEIDNMKSSKQKLLRRLEEIQGELSHETSLRESLEESHNTLLQRVQEMGLVVEGEREEVATVNRTCTALKKECVSAQSELQREQCQRSQLEQYNNKLARLAESKDVKIASMEDDRQTLMKELGRMREQYTTFNSQLDSMKNELKHTLNTDNQQKKEIVCLKEAIKSAATENAQLITNYEHELEVARLAVEGRCQEDVSVSQLKEQLKEESRDKTQALAKCCETEKEVSCLRSQLDETQGEMNEMVRAIQKEVDTLRDQLKTAQEEKSEILLEKDSLLDEVNQAVDAMTEEKNRLDVELQQARSEVASQRNAFITLAQTNAALQQRVSSLEEQQNQQMKLSVCLHETQEHKNRLAYEKGRLEKKVEQLQHDLQSHSSMEAELQQLKECHKLLEAKYTKSQTDLSEYNKQYELLESHSKQLTRTTQSKVEDLELVIEMRDKAIQENEEVTSRIESLKEAQALKVQGLQQNLFAAEVDTCRVTETLETVLQSHQQVQVTIEQLEMQLGNKDAVISRLKSQITDKKQTIQQLRKDMSSLRDEIAGMETGGSSEVVSLRKALEKCREDKVCLSEAAEKAQDARDKLHTQLRRVSDDFEKKSHLLKELRTAREKATEDMRREVATYEARLANLTEQLAKEREKSVRKTSRDVTEVRKQLENSLSRNAEMSKQNTMLKQQVSELETDLKETKVKMSAQRNHIEHLTKMRRKQDDELHKLQGLSQQLSQLEITKNEYVKKLKEQSKMTEGFISEISSLQTEIELLAKCQVDMTQVSQAQQVELHKVLSLNTELERKYQSVLERERCLEMLHADMEKKLLETNVESIQKPQAKLLIRNAAWLFTDKLVLELFVELLKNISKRSFVIIFKVSSSLQDTHKWFKSKFDQLHEDGRCRAMLQPMSTRVMESSPADTTLVDETTQKATAMIQASRETISRLTNYATLSQRESSSQLQVMREKLEIERSRALHMENKLKTFQESSLRHTEELARELDFLKQHLTASHDSS